MTLNTKYSVYLPLKLGSYVFTRVYLGDDLPLFGALVFPVKKGRKKMQGELEALKR